MRAPKKRINMNMRTSEEFYRKLDEIRRAYPGNRVPSRSEMIRLVIDEKHESLIRPRGQLRKASTA